MNQPIQAMVLAAGRGQRMRPLTDTTPKPLLAVQGKPLLQWHVDALAAGGFAELVLNTDWLGEQIPAYFGAQPHDSRGRPLHIRYSHEGLDFGGALETLGGIVRALPLLGDIFWIVAGDVYAPGFEFSLPAVQRFARSDKLAHLWLVPNPPHNPRGDFGLSDEGLALNLGADQPGPRHTYSTIGLYRRALFQPPWCDIPAGNPQGIKTPLAPLLRRAMDNQRISAELYTGAWTDVGTPERLAQLNQTADS
jgi:MurNAc alpha-1-phosphate uridylyltransferase